MLKIGVTGGIGTGKTTVCRIFEVLNIPVYFSDNRAKNLMISNQDIISKLKSSFGEQVIDSQGLLKTSSLASIVFQNLEMLEVLNNIVHPYVLADFANWCNDQKDAPYVILESAIIYERRIEHLLDYVIIVDAPPEARLQRIIKRDHVTAEDVMLRIKNQLAEDDIIHRSNLSILNDGKHSLIDQVLNLHKAFSEQKD